MKETDKSLATECKLIKDPTITDQERFMRIYFSHKPNFCGSCHIEQRFDDIKECHNVECRRDPHYNPENLDIGSGYKTYQDYDAFHRAKMGDKVNNNNNFK
jgi:hypothetical protein